MHGTIGSYNISAFWYLPKYANRWNKYSKWRSMDWARCLLLIIEKPNKYLPDQAQLSIAAFIPIEDWQYIGRFLTWHSQLTSIWPILNLEGASARLGSVRPLKPVTPEHTSRLCWHTGSSQKAQHQTPVFNSTSRGRLPRCIDGLSMNAYFTSQCHSSRCGARLLQSYRSSALRLHATRHLSCTCRITKRTKTNTDLYSTIESEGHTYLLEYSPKSLPATQLPWTSR